jgi:hypothetical protein
VRSYLKELARSGADWSFAPVAEYDVRLMSADHKVADDTGKEYPDWETEGTALFAGDAQAFPRILPACVERQNATWTDFSDLSLS